MRAEICWRSTTASRSSGRASGALARLLLFQPGEDLVIFYETACVRRGDALLDSLDGALLSFHTEGERICGELFRASAGSAGDVQKPGFKLGSDVGFHMGKCNVRGGAMSETAQFSRWTELLPAHWRVKPIRRVAVYRVSSVDKLALDGEAPVRLCNYTDVRYNETSRPSLG